jgi:transcriptional regulator with XRE-family HTH domain
MRDEDIYRAIGGRLRARRRSLDLTQREVAMSCGLTFQQIQKYEAGLVAMPVGRLLMLAQVLEAPLTDLVAGIHGGSPSFGMTAATSVAA